MSEHVMFGFRVNANGDWTTGTPVPAVIDCDDESVTIATADFAIIDTHVKDNMWVRTLMAPEGVTTFRPHFTADGCYVEISETAVTSNMGLL